MQEGASTGFGKPTESKREGKGEKGKREAGGLEQHKKERGRAREGGRERESDRIGRGTLGGRGEVRRQRRGVGSEMRVAGKSVPFGAARRVPCSAQRASVQYAIHNTGMDSTVVSYFVESRRQVRLC